MWMNEQDWFPNTEDSNNPVLQSTENVFNVFYDYIALSLKYSFLKKFKLSKK